MAKFFKTIKANIKPLIIGILAGVFINSAALFAIYHERYQPYGDVETIYVEKSTEDDSVDYRANFDKFRDDCEFEALAPFAVSLGQYRKLEWEELTGRGQTDNRTEGAQTLDVKIYLNGAEPEEIELRTRHLCPNRDGDIERVTKTFSTFEVPLDKTPDEP